MLKAFKHLSNPLRPDDYFEMINPLWTTQELRGKVDRVEREGTDAVSVFIRPGTTGVGTSPASTSDWAWSSTAAITGAPTRSPPTRTATTA